MRIARERYGLPVEEIPTNEAMQRGIDNEVNAMNCFNKKAKKELGIVFEHNDEFLKTEIAGVVCGGTPDAISKDNYSLEIKTPMPNNYIVQKGDPPYRYFLQSIMQRMIMQKVTGEKKDKSFLFIYSPEEKDGVIFTIPNDNKRTLIVRDTIIQAEKDIEKLIEKFKKDKEKEKLLNEETGINY